MPVIYNPYDDEELRAIRDSQDDPLIQYYIIRKSLGMSEGKMVVQAAHAAYIFAKYHMQRKREVYSVYRPHGGAEVNRINLVDKWEEISFTKIAKKAPDGKFEKIKEEFDCLCVRDAGKTEVPSGSETVLVLFPMYRSETPEIIWKLRNL